MSKYLDEAEAALDREDIAAYEAAMRRYEISKGRQETGQAPAVEFTASDVARQALGQGLALGFGDEIEAALSAPFSERSYEDIRDQIRERNKLLERERPVATAAMQIGGGLLTGGLGAARAGGVSALRHTPTLARMAGIGAGEGAIAGLGHSEKEALGQTIQDVGLGAAVGGLVGAGTRAAVPALERFASRTPATAADRGLRQAIEARLGREEAERTIREIGEPVRLADLTPELQARAQVIGNVPGGRDIGKIASEVRLKAQIDRIDNEIRAITGIKETGLEALDRSLAKRSRDAATAYRKAYSVPVEPDDVLPIIASKKRGSWKFDPDAEKAFKKALVNYQRRTRIELDPTSPEDITDLQFWDYFYRSLRDIRDRLAKKGDKTSSSAITENLLTPLAKELDDQTTIDGQSLYGVARFQFSKTSGIQDHVRDGMKSASRSVTSEEVKRRLKDSSEEERIHYAIGLIADLIVRLGTTPELAAKARRITAFPETRKKLALALGGGDQADRVLSMLNREAIMAETDTMVVHGSRTFPMMAEAQGISRATNLLGNLLRDPIAAAQDIASMSADKLSARIAEPNAELLARRLFADNPLLQLQQIYRPGVLGRAVIPGMLGTAAPIGGLTATDTD